jgi:hypothetical protein
MSASKEYFDRVRLGVNQKLRVVITYTDGSEETHYEVFDSTNAPAYLFNIKEILCNSEFQFMTYQLYTAVFTITRV